MEHNDHNKVDDGAHDDEKRSDFKAWRGIIVEADGEGACVACLAARGGGGGTRFGRGAAEALAKAGGRRSCGAHI